MSQPKVKYGTYQKLLFITNQQDWLIGVNKKEVASCGKTECKGKRDFSI